MKFKLERMNDNLKNGNSNFAIEQNEVILRDKFKELHFLADIDNLIRNLRENNVPGENCLKLKRHQKGTQKHQKNTIK